MWDGKKKALTFSFDDGVTQDIRLIEILDKYGLKCTFNLNSEFLGLDGTLFRNGRTVRHDKIKPEAVKEIYKGHEVAVHGKTHAALGITPSVNGVRDVLEGRLGLEKEFDRIREEKNLEFLTYEEWQKEQLTQAFMEGYNSP